MFKTPLIIDADPGIDDAVALALAFFTKKLRIDLITTTPGNVGIEEVTQNALNLVNCFGRKINVAKGVSEPLEVKTMFAKDVQGLDGLGGYKFSKHHLKPINKIAHDAMFDVLKKNGAGGTTLVLMGPATNAAMLLTVHPESKKYIKEIVVLAASLEGINNSGKIYSEFNVKNDPHAMDIVLNSGVPVVILPMEMGHYAYLTNDEIAKGAKMNDAGKMFAYMFKSYKDNHVKVGAATHDPCLIAFLSNRKMFEAVPVLAQVNLEETRRGETMFTLGVHQSNLKLCLKIDIKKFKKFYFKTLKRMKIS